MSYSIQILPSALRELAALPKLVRSRIIKRIDALASEPRPSGTKLLQGGTERRWRFRVGNYRVIYRIEDAVLVIVVIKVGHRGEVCR